MTWNKVAEYLLGIFAICGGVIVIYWVLETIRTLIGDGIEISDVTVISILMHPVSILVSFIAGGYILNRNKDK